MNRVEELILDLSWYKTEEEIKEAQDKLVDIMTVETLGEMIPLYKYPKGYWEGVARVIQLISEKVDIKGNDKLISDMFQWLQDMNWPGAQVISEVIKTLDREFVIQHIERITQVDNQDPEWLYFISAWLVKGLEIKNYEFKNKRNYDILMRILDEDETI